jgi:DNA-binding transcriptional LysR family regulator
MKQQTLAMAADHNAQFEKYRKPTRRDKFSATMDKLVPWAALCSVIEPHYPVAGIRAFCAAARTGQFNEAAERLHLSPSALSRRIASIEDAVGARVFDRSTRQVRLTSLGVSLYEDLSPLLSALDGTFAQAARSARGETGTLVVAMVATVAYSVLPDQLEPFKERHPGVYLCVRDGIAASIADLVERRQPEFGISTHTAFGSALDAELLGTYSFNLVGLKTDPWLRRRKSASWDELRGRPVVGLNPTSSTRLQVDGELAGLAIPTPWSLEVDQFSTMLSLIKSKSYCAVLPTLFNATREGLVSLPLVKPVMQRQLYLVRRRDSELSAQALFLADLFRAALATPGAHAQGSVSPRQSPRDRALHG